MSIRPPFFPVGVAGCWSTSSSSATSRPFLRAPAARIALKLGLNLGCLDSPCLADPALGQQPPEGGKEGGMPPATLGTQGGRRGGRVPAPPGPRPPGQSSHTMSTGHLEDGGPVWEGVGDGHGEGAPGRPGELHSHGEDHLPLPWGEARLGYRNTDLCTAPPPTQKPQ